MPNVYLGLGSNIGPKHFYLRQGIDLLKNIFGTLRCSSFYETEPFQNINQPSYLNCCVVLSTILTPHAVLESLKGVETKLGRPFEREKGTNRTLDIDILLYGEESLTSEILTIPHYDLERRDFFLFPLLELEPSLINPRSQEKLAEELKKLPANLKTLPKKINL